MRKDSSTFWISETAVYKQQRQAERAEDADIHVLDELDDAGELPRSDVARQHDEQARRVREARAPARCGFGLVPDQVFERAAPSDRTASQGPGFAAAPVRDSRAAW
jgi:hypothetical protein